MTKPISCVILRYNQETETTGAHNGLGDIPLKVSERIRNMNAENDLTLTEELLKAVTEAEFLTAWEKNQKETLAMEWEELRLRYLERIRRIPLPFHGKN